MQNIVRRNIRRYLAMAVAVILSPLMAPRMASAATPFVLPHLVQTIEKPSVHFQVGMDVTNTKLWVGVDVPSPNASVYLQDGTLESTTDLGGLHLAPNSTIDHDPSGLTYADQGAGQVGVFSPSHDLLGTLAYPGDHFAAVTVMPNGNVYVLSWTQPGDGELYNSLHIQLFSYATAPIAPDLPPLKIAPVSDVTLVATSDTGAPASYATPGTTDGVAVCNPPNGTVLPVGKTTAVCWVKDRFGRTASTSFTITVLPMLKIDNIVDIGTVADATGRGYVFFVPPGASTGTVTCSQPPGLFPIGYNEVTCSVTANSQTKTTLFRVWVRGATDTVHS